MIPGKKSLIAMFAFGLTAAAPFVCAQDAAAPTPPPDAGAPAPATTDQTPPPKRGKKGRDPMRMVMSKVDNLTDDQNGKIADIEKDSMGKGRDIRDDTTLSDDDKQAKMMANMKSEQEQIRALLTPDQQTQFDSAVKSMRGKKGRKKGGDDGAPPPPPADGSAPPPPPPTI
jgi:Spy/CpxP family protein refolding chaperone